MSELQKDREVDLIKKDEDIRDLKRKIEDMSAEFARMLRVIIHYFEVSSYDLNLRKLLIKCKKELNWPNGIMIMLIHK